MNFKSMIWQAVPLLIGILIGAGLTKNPYIFALVIGYVIFFFIFSLVKDKIIKVHESTNKIEETKKQAWETVQNVGEATLKGNQIGTSMFDRFYKEYSFYFSGLLLVVMIGFLFTKNWAYAGVMFIILNMFIVINQNQRSSREIKEYLESETK